MRIGLAILRLFKKIFNNYLPGFSKKKIPNDWL